MSDKIVNHFVLADGSTAKYSADSLVGTIPELVDSGLNLKFSLSFNVASGVNHGSDSDKMMVDISAGSIAYLSLAFPADASTTIVWVGTKPDGTTYNITSGNNKAVTIANDTKYISVYFTAVTQGGLVSMSAEVYGRLDYLNKQFAIGQVVGYINCDWTAKTVNVPIAVMFDIHSQATFTTEATTLDASSMPVFFCLVFNYSTRLFELFTYTQIQTMDGSQYRIVAVLRKDQRWHISPFEITFNGVSQTATDKTLGVEYGVADARAAGLLHSFVVGYLQDPINFDTANATIYVPIGVMYKPGTNEFVVIPAATLEISPQNSAYILCVNWETSAYILLPYADYKSQPSTKYSAIAAFNRMHPESCASPYKITVNGVSPILTIDDNIGPYWVEELDNVIDNVAQLQTYENGVTFGFITDIHWETNWQKSPKVIDYIVNHSRIDMWLNGGDSATGDGGDGTEQKELLYKCIGSFGKGYKFYSLNGNHDTNQIGGGTMLTSADIKNLVMPYDNDVTFGDGNYYWFDYRGTRFVCLDTGTNGLSDSAQTTWAASVISASTLPVIVCMHIVKISHTDENPCPFFNDLITAIGANSDGKVKMIIGGHSHHDFNFIASNGIPVIVLDTDSRFSDDGISRVSGTISEQCLSVVTIDYDAEKINVTRVGSVGSDIIVNY